MKKSVLILGIALVSFSNICNAKNATDMPFNLFQDTFLSDDNLVVQSNEVAKFGKPSLVEEEKVFNPETVIARNLKTVEEIIAEGDKITEYVVSNDLEFMEYEESMRQIIAQSDLIIENSVSNETHYLDIERSVEDKIAELELIIESNETNKEYSLDFKKINTNLMRSNSFNTDKILGMN
jgi:DNA polymerase III epsilon subunit-like protein